MIGELSVSTEDKVLLPDDSLIVLADSGVYPTWNLHGDLHFCNHNIFRLDKDGKVIWQVQREELGKIRWDRIMAEVDQKGEEGASFSRIPFGELWLENKDGNRFQSNIFVLGCKLIALASGGRNYEVDINTGVATNIDEPGNRLW